MSEQLGYVKAFCLSYLSRFERSNRRLQRFLEYWEDLADFLVPTGGSITEALIWAYDPELPHIFNTQLLSLSFVI